MMSAKRGRPLTSNEPKNKPVHVMIKESTYKAIKAYCAENRCTISDVIRELIEKRFDIKE